MKKDTRNDTVQGLEAKANELLSLIYAITEERQAASKAIPPAVRDKALAAAALAVQQAVETFIVVNRIE